MDASPDVLAEQVRAKRVAIDNDLELLRTRLQKVDPRRVDGARWARLALPVLAGLAAIFYFARRRRPIRSLDQLLATGLGELYAAEQQLVPALRRMRDKASNAELRQAFETHLHETEGQVERLQRIFQSIETDVRPARTSAGIIGLIAEGELMVHGVTDPDVLDAALIAAAQRIEHVEIATYGTVRTYAETLGYSYAAQLLQQTLDEERATDAVLTQLAERFVNPRSLRTA